MFSLEELFCQLDDFCQSFESQWRQQLLGHGLQIRNRSRQLCISFDYDDFGWLSSAALPQFQALLQ